MCYLSDFSCHWSVLFEFNLELLHKTEGTILGQTKPTIKSIPNSFRSLALNVKSTY